MTVPVKAIVDALAGAYLLVERAGDGPAVVTAVTDDSRSVVTGALFCAVQGTVVDGHRFVKDARRAGAAVAMVARRVDVDLPQLVVADDRAAAAVVAATFHGRPAERLSLVGVTGTNGKSTTVALVRHLLNETGTVGALGTLGARDGTGTVLADEGLTTPGAIALHETLAALARTGCDRVVMETSSHALDQRRTFGLEFDAGVFTNLTHDHLDYHGDLTAYRRAKLRLADQVKGTGVLVVNADDPAWSALARDDPRALTFGCGDARVRARDISMSPDGTTFTLDVPGTAGLQIRWPLLGGFNVANGLAAVATALGLGLSPETVVPRLETAPQVPGRLERLDAGDYVVLRDYAHTPDALRRALAAVRPLAAGRLLVVFGCGGDRDRRKRAPMGAIAVENADVAIVTSDNPRTEDPERIIDDVEAGMAGHAYHRIADRREAIYRAIALMGTGDVLLLAGKGHEDYQVLGTDKVPFDEPALVREAVSRRARS